MANYTAADVKKLRELTAAGMMDCKKALEENDGNLDKAVEYLRVKGLKGVTKREGRSASNGLVIAAVDGQRHPGRAALRDGLRRQERGLPDRRRHGARARRLGRPGRRPGAARRGARAGQDRAVVPGRGQRPARREDRAAPLRPVPRRLRRVLPAQDQPGHPGRRSASSSSWTLDNVGGAERNAEVAKDVAQHIAAFSPSFLTRDEIPADTSRPRSASPRRPPARRASPRPPCRRSSRVGSTASSRRTSCWSRRSPRTPRRPSRRSSTRPAYGEAFRPVPRRRLTAGAATRSSTTSTRSARERQSGNTGYGTEATYRGAAAVKETRRRPTRRRLLSYARPPRPRYRRVLLKLSGEVFGGGRVGVDPEVVQSIAGRSPAWSASRRGRRGRRGDRRRQLLPRRRAVRCAAWTAPAPTTWACSARS